MRAMRWCVVAAMLGSATPVAAQTVTNYVPEGDIEKNEDRDRKGWDGALGITAQLSLAQNANVVGQNDGTSFLAGLGLLGGLDYIYGRHELRNTLTINESFARTPVLDEWIKTNDVVTLEILYNYFFTSWLGGFGRLDFNANALPTDDVRANPVTYAITDSAGMTSEQSATTLRLADSFAQLTLNQSVGLFMQPVKKKEVAFSVRLGFGFRESLTDGVLVVTDDAATTDRLEVTRLDTVLQGGGELFTGVRGELYEKRMKYEIGASALLPLLNNDPQGRSATDLLRVGAVGSLSFNVFDWMSVNFQSRLTRDPQLLDELQIQNNILLTFQYNFIERTAPKTKVGPSPLEIAQKKAKEAEERAKQAEDRAKQAEKRTKQQAQIAALERFGIVDLQGTPAGATLVIDGQPRYVKSADGTWRALTIAPGVTKIGELSTKKAHTFTVSAPGYAPKTVPVPATAWPQDEAVTPVTKLSTQLAASPGFMGQEAKARLKLKTGTSHPGALVLATTPGANILIDGKPALDAKGKALTSPASVTEYYVRGSKNKLERRQIHVDAGKAVTVQVVGTPEQPRYAVSVERGMWTCNRKSEAARTKLPSVHVLPLECDFVYKVDVTLAALATTLKSQEAASAAAAQGTKAVEQKIQEFKKSVPKADAPKK